jgi:hypothetical protein
MNDRMDLLIYRTLTVLLGVSVLLVVLMLGSFVLLLLGVIHAPAPVQDVQFFTHCDPALLPTGIMGWRCQ